MASHCSVKYKKLRNTDSEATNKQVCELENEEDEVAVFLYSSSTLYNKMRPGRGSLWFRVFVDLVILGVALMFVFCEWHEFVSSDNRLKDYPEYDHHWKIESMEQLNHHLDGHNHTEGEGHGHHYNSSRHMYEHLSSIYHHAVVITDSTICSRAGKYILEDGGNLVDAAIAALLCLGVVHPHTAGVGGVFSGILYNHTTGMSKGIHATFHRTLSTTYGIPATLQGMRSLHSQFGVYKWENLFVIAIQLAKDGFPIDNSLALALKSNEEKICSSKLSELFCHRNQSIKAMGSVVTNQKLSELLRNISVNYSYLSESLAIKLAEDLPLVERQDFVRNIQECHGEVIDPIIFNEEKFSVFTSASALSVRIISNSIKRIREQNISFWSNVDPHYNTSYFINLLNTAKLIYRSALENQSLEDLAVLNMESSYIGILDNTGNVLIISSTLNSAFGSMQFLPSTGVILSDYSLHPALMLSQWSCPLLIKFKNSDSEEELAIGMTGGLSAPFIASQIIINRLYLGKSALQAVTSPLLHLEMRSPGSLLACISTVLDGSDSYKLLIDTEYELQAVNECVDKSLAFVMQTHEGHVTGYGVPAASAYTDGY